jgi:hypothetical protein
MNRNGLERPTRTTARWQIWLPPLALVVNSALVGASGDQVIKQLPARQVIGVVAYSAYSRAGDLANGVAWYAGLGIGSAVLALATVAVLARADAGHPRWPMTVVVTATAGHLAVTAVAAPLDFSQRHHLADPVALARIFDTFAALSALRGVLQCAALAALAVLATGAVGHGAS